MAKRKTVWKVETGDENFRGANNKFLLEGATAAVVESKALKLAVMDTARGEAKSKPFVRSIELVGEIDG